MSRPCCDAASVPFKLTSRTKASSPSATIFVGRSRWAAVLANEVLRNPGIARTTVAALNGSLDREAMSTRTNWRPKTSRQNATRLCSGSVSVENRRGEKSSPSDSMRQCPFGIDIVALLLRSENYALSQMSIFCVAPVHDGRTFPEVGCRHTLSKTIELILRIAGAKGRRIVKGSHKSRPQTRHTHIRESNDGRSDFTCAADVAQGGRRDARDPGRRHRAAGRGAGASGGEDLRSVGHQRSACRNRQGR